MGSEWRERGVTLMGLSGKTWSDAHRSEWQERGVTLMGLSGKNVE